MAAKLNQNGPYREFHCPGCGFDHAVDGRWTWNSSLDRPSFQPSVKVESGKGICHFYVTDGKIIFGTDCTAHKFSGQTLDLPNWETTQEEKPMTEKKDFNPGDQVKLLAPHVSGLTAEVVHVNSPNGVVCKITSSEHPSGHSQEGTLMMFPTEQLQAQDVAEKKEVSL